MFRVAKSCYKHAVIATRALASMAWGRKGAPQVINFKHWILKKAVRENAKNKTIPKKLGPGQFSTRQFTIRGLCGGRSQRSSQGDGHGQSV